ncbi:MAG TPA: hypothetical protein VG820_02780, partial [Fimbriimonadaceae bacterium]|nr:hypothetical protein [Fimbriimonadaceae bacterium]
MAVKEAAKSPERKPPAQAKTPTCACGRPLGADGMCDACRQKAMARPSKLGGHSFGRLSVTPAEHPIEREAKDLAEKAIQGR